MATQPTSSSTSPTLLARVRKFDADAWDRLTRLYGPIVYRWCRKAGLQDNDAADISQEVFRAVATSIGSFQHDEPGSSFRGWLWTITHNKVRDYYRWLSNRPGAEGGSDAHQRLQRIPEAESDAEAVGDFDATSSVVHRALELVRVEFEERTFHAFLRVTTGGQSAATVAADLGMTVGAVCTAKWRVLRRLREEVNDLL